MGFRAQWTWSGGQDNVKAYPYAGKTLNQKRLVSQIGSIPTSVSWNYQGNNLRANVAYDLFTASNPNHDTSSGDYELMIWLGRLGGIYPIGSKVGNVNLAGQNFELWDGYNGGMRVFSFVTTGQINSFNADIKNFFNYLSSNRGFPAGNQYLISKSPPLGNTTERGERERPSLVNILNSGSVRHRALHWRPGHFHRFELLDQCQLRGQLSPTNYRTASARCFLEKGPLSSPQYAGVSRFSSVGGLSASVFTRLLDLQLVLVHSIHTGINIHLLSSVQCLFVRRGCSAHADGAHSRFSVVARGGAERPVFLILQGKVIFDVVLPCSSRNSAKSPNNGLRRESTFSSCGSYIRQACPRPSSVLIYTSDSSPPGNIPRSSPGRKQGTASHNEDIDHAPNSA